MSRAMWHYSNRFNKWFTDFSLDSYNWTNAWNILVWPRYDCVYAFFHMISMLNIVNIINEYDVYSSSPICIVSLASGVGYSSHCLNLLYNVRGMHRMQESCVIWRAILYFDDEAGLLSPASFVFVVTSSFFCLSVNFVDSNLTRQRAKEVNDLNSFVRSTSERPVCSRNTEVVGLRPCLIRLLTAKLSDMHVAWRSGGSHPVASNGNWLLRCYCAKIREVWFLLRRLYINMSNFDFDLPTSTNVKCFSDAVKSRADDEC